MAGHPTDLMTCAVCLETFTDPHMLGDCGHSFCKACIQGMSNSDQARRVGLKCPTCRKPFRQNQVLPNFALRALLGERGQSQPGAPSGNAGGEAASGEGGGGSPGHFGDGGQGDRSERTSVLGAGADGLVRSNFEHHPTIDYLVTQGCPYELGKLVFEESKQIAKRVFLLDNSGSTQYPDGQVLEPDASGELKWRRCTRWEECCQMATTHAQWNLDLGIPAQFVLLNSKCATETLEEGMDYCVVDKARGDGEAQVKTLEAMLKANGPRGVTPISDRLRKIYREIQPQARELVLNNQTVNLIIATDGMPTSTRSGQSTWADQQEITREIRRVSADLPIHIVIRLCTSDNEVADFYNKVDEDPEVNLEIVDDMASEAQECAKAGNRWLVYTPMLQLIREGGTYLKVLDLVDERRLDPMEVFVMAQLLLRCEAEDPLMSSEPEEFCRQARALLNKCPPVFDPVYKTMCPPVRISELEWAVLPKSEMQRVCGGDACSLM